MIFLIAVVVNIITAIYSTGYYYADEHYQVIEFAGYKLGTHQPDELAWEFAYKLRPALQPAICYVLIKTASALGTSEPFTQAMLLRIISMALSLAAVTIFIKSFIDEFKTTIGKLFFLLLSYLLWFMPFLNVRFASESWAGALLLLMLALLKFNVCQRKWCYFFIPVVIAASILIRYQMLLPVMVILAWYSFKRQHAQVILIASGILLSIPVGLLIDHWFYGEWTLPLYNYAHMVITGSGPDFGSEPWYFYPLCLTNKMFLPIGLLLLISFMYLWTLAWKNLITPITLVFLLFHSVIPHKEVRFLFPLAGCCGFVFAFAIEKILSLNWSTKIATASLRIIACLLLVINGALLIISIWLPASPGIEIARVISRQYKTGIVTLLHTPYSNPYNPFESVPVKFYLQHHVHTIKINDVSNINDTILRNSQSVLLSIRSDVYEQHKLYLENLNFKLVAYAWPPLLVKWNHDIWLKANDNFVLLEKISN